MRSGTEYLLRGLAPMLMGRAAIPVLPLLI
jgi:hypothetical protein